MPFASVISLKSRIRSSAITRTFSHLSYVGDAELGSRSNIGAGTITANYNHVTKEKFRTVIGDDASTGSNSVLVAPVRLGHGAFLAAGSVATKNIPDGALGVGRARQEN